MTDAPSRPGDRIAKVIARAGLASRRDAEAMIEALRVQINGRTVSNVATNVGPRDRVTVDGAPLPEPEGARLWLYHKPAGLVTSARDEKGRETVFDALPAELGRVLSVGRLDLNSEGLLLLTNDGDLKRRLELPATGWLRRYRVRVNGRPAEGPLDRLRAGIVVDGETFAPMQVTLDRQQGANAWLTIGLREGRNREVRRALEAVGLMVNRLIRISYGPFQLGQLAPGAVEEARPRVLREQLGGLFDGALAESRKGGPMAAKDKEGQDRPEGAEAATGRKPRPSGDRLVEHGRGGPRDEPPRGGPGGKGGKGGGKDRPVRADRAEQSSDRAARPDRPRTAKPPVTRSDGEGSGSGRPRRDRDAGYRADGNAKPRAAAGGRPHRKDDSRPPRAAGSDRPRRGAEDGPHRKSREGGERPGGPRARREGGETPAGREGGGTGRPLKKGARDPRPKDGDRTPPRPGGGGATGPRRDGEGAKRPPRGTSSGGEQPQRPSRPSRQGAERSPESKGPRRADGNRPPRGGPKGPATERPRETKDERTARLRSDTSVSLRKGGQKGHGIVRPKKAPSTKRMHKPGDGAQED